MGLIRDGKSLLQKSTLKGIMFMKFTDLMLDMATGDASGHDVMVEYDLGKINVSSVIFEACAKVEALDEANADDNGFFQEAADAGLPSDKEGATAQATAASGASVEAFYDLVVDASKKLKESTGKDWKAIAALGKKMGVSVGDAKGENFTEAFARPLAQKICAAAGKGKAVKLSGKAFVTANFARNFTSDYCNGMAKILSAYGIGMNCDCPVTKNFVGDLSKIVPCADTSDSCVQQAAQAIKQGAKAIKGEGMFSKTANATVKDIETYITAVYVLNGFADCVVKRAGNKSTRKTATGKLNAMVADTNKKGISHAAKNITKTISDRASTIKEATDAVAKSFTDAIYALTEALNGGEAPLPKADKKSE
jgi:hypothetical protein